ncbi:hypothetical protein MLD38_004153 [Melastoma candidum]|uniref:Uncharacterized protein n=1 Tax=Melastoma candidum TaxID=119954 RepID=A0ACB9S541_9MYRT|nr:hypothetical protein MLD38_004153 [Melastoma candidum]
MPWMPKTMKQSFPFLILLLSSLSIFLFFTLSPTRLHPDLDPNVSAGLRRPFHRNFTLIVKVLAYNRLPSLSRCLRSLSAADYLTDIVHLHIYLDHFRLPSDSPSHDLDASNEMLEFVDKFRWRFGEKVVHYRTTNVGLQAQWLEAWWPSDDRDEFAFIVEDDLEVSPLYYRFVREIIERYYYDERNRSPWIYGITLQRPRFVPGKHGNKIVLDDKTRVFLYQLVGTWGQILFPKHWKEFRRWYDDHKARDIKPMLDGMVTTGWYKRMGEKIWTPWFIKFIHARGYFNIYTNFLQERSLSVSHRDAGVNYGKSAGPDSQLLDKSNLDFNLYDVPPLRNLKWYDFCFGEVLLDRVVRNIVDLATVLGSVQKKETVLLVSLFGVSDVIARNMLCNFERLDIHNYILMGPGSDLLFDLARRGHPVIDTDQFLSSVMADKFRRYQGSSLELMKGIMAKVYVLKTCVEVRYDIWLLDGNVLVPNLDIFSTSGDSIFDLYVLKSLSGFLLRSSSTVRRVWKGSFADEAEAMTRSLLDKNSGKGEHISMVGTVTSLLESRAARIKKIDDEKLSVNIDYAANGSTQDKVVYWSHGTGFDSVRKRLEELKLWFLDADSSCSAVVCHRS